MIICNTCGQTVSEMARNALNNPSFYTATNMSQVDSIESVNDLVFKALNTPSWALDHYNPLKPEQIAIKAFVNRMGPDLTGPNFNQSQEETVEVLAKRAKHNLFGADESDTKAW